MSQTLAKLQQPVESLLIHIILPKIDKGSRREWEQKRNVIEEFPTLNEFVFEFLTNRSASLESVSRVNRNFKDSNYYNNRSNTKR